MRAEGPLRDDTSSRAAMDYQIVKYYAGIVTAKHYNLLF